MQPRRHDGRAYACRFGLVVLSLATLAFVASPVRASAADLTGTVVDQNGRPLPRAHVRIVAGGGSQPSDAGHPSDVFADNAGRFTLRATGACQVEASLAGFRTITVGCTEVPMRIELPLAPAATRSGCKSHTVPPL